MTPAAAYAGIVDGLRDALKPAGVLRVLDGPGERADPGSVIVGPPAFIWEGMCGGGPSSATVIVYLIERVGERAIERLLENLPALVAAIEEINDATVTGAAPASYPSGSAELPAYQVTAEISL